MLAAFGGQPQPVQRVSRRATQRSYSAPAPREIPPSPIRDLVPITAKDEPLAPKDITNEAVHFTRGRVRDKNSTVDKLPFDNPIERQQALQQGGYITRESFIPFPCKKRAKEQEEVIFGKRAPRNNAVEEDLAFVITQQERLRSKQKYGASQRFNDSGKIITGEVSNPDRVADSEHHVLKVGGKPKKFGLHPTYTAQRRGSGVAAEGSILAPSVEPRRNGIRVYNSIDTRDLLNYDPRSNETVVSPLQSTNGLPPFSPRRPAPATPRSPRQYEYKDPPTATLLKWPVEITTPLESEMQRKGRREQDNTFHQKLIRDGYPQTRAAQRNRGLRHIATDYHINTIFDYEAPKPMKVEPRDFFTASRAKPPPAPTVTAVPRPVPVPVPAPTLAAKPPLAARHQPTTRGLRTGYAHATQSTTDLLCPSPSLDTPRSEGRARVRSQSQPPPRSFTDVTPQPPVRNSPAQRAPSPTIASTARPSVAPRESPPQRSRSAPAPPAQRRLSSSSISLQF